MFVRFFRRLGSSDNFRNFHWVTHTNKNNNKKNNNKKNNRNKKKDPIGLYTPINYFGRYATYSHNKDGGRSHIQSREIIGQENHVTCLKLRPRVNFRPAFGTTSKTRIFYKYVVSKHSLFSHNFFSAATHSLQCDSTDIKLHNMDGPRRHS